MAERKGISAPVPRCSSTEAAGAPERSAAVSATVPVERGRLCMEGAGGQWLLLGTRLLLGRAGARAGADVEIADESVSRRHAELVATAEGWLLRDLGSVNGTSVGEDAVKAGESVALAEGQVIRVGTVELRVVRR